MTTTVRRPQSNGFVARLHRTLLDERSRVTGQRNFHEGIGEMQKYLDPFHVQYNTKRPHQGRDMNGRTPQKAFAQSPQKPKNKGVEK